MSNVLRINKMQNVFTAINTLYCRGVISADKMKELSELTSSSVNNKEKFLELQEEFIRMDHPVAEMALGAME